MGASTIAAIDIGSKNLKFVMGHLNGNILQSKIIDKVTLNIGHHVAENKGHIRASKLDEIVEAAVAKRDKARSLGTNVFLAVATQAVKRADNRDTLCQKLESNGIHLEIADAQREATLDYLAATHGQSGFVVSDFGSRSLQIAARMGDYIETFQLQLGYVDVYEHFFLRNARFFDAAVEFQGMLAEHLVTDQLMAPNFLAMAFKSMGSYATGEPKDKLDRQFLRREQIQNCITRLKNMSLDEWSQVRRKTPKAEKVFPGLVLAEYLTYHMGYGQIRLIGAELPLGLIVEHFNKAGVKLAGVYGDENGGSES